MLRMTDLDLSNKRVLIREDLNVPLKEGEITSDARIQASLVAIKFALKANARVMLMSHLGRPVEGTVNPELSLAPVAARLSELLGQEVLLITNYLEEMPEVKPGQVVLFENVRFNFGEKGNSPELAKKLASYCDIFVMDAFASAHRTEASTYGVAEYAPIACAGPLLCKEIDALTQVMENPKKPVLAIIGGSKVSTKLKLLESLSEKVDALIVGGGIANTFLAAEGYDIGSSLYEIDLIDAAEHIIETMRSRDAAVPIPEDVVVAEKMSNEVEAFEEAVGQIATDEKIFDIGTETIKTYVKLIKSAGTILWNGPVGAFEIDQFSTGTEMIANAIAQSKAFSVAGGGDTLAAIEKYQLEDKISYISTGGGAFLAYIEQGSLPAIDILT